MTDSTSTKDHEEFLDHKLERDVLDTQYAELMADLARFPTAEAKELARQLKTDHDILKLYRHVEWLVQKQGKLHGDMAKLYRNIAIVSILLATYFIVQLVARLAT